MEPMLISETAKRRPELNDLVFELVDRAAGFKRSLPVGMTAALSDLVRSMNCYYSNLIEGHDTHPTAIERAMNTSTTQTPRRGTCKSKPRRMSPPRGGSTKAASLVAPLLSKALRASPQICEALPDDLLWVTNPDTHERLRGLLGEWRRRNVKVGLHEAISPGAVPRSMERFEAAYSGLSRAQAVIHAAAAHHRLLWIHPFLDGNGRVARLMSHAMLLETLDTGSVWSVARGLARAVPADKGHLAECDLGRRNNWDGRGHLSEEALTEFTAGSRPCLVTAP